MPNIGFLGEPVLLKNVGKPAALTVDGYRQGGGYQALAKALAMQPAAVIDMVKASGLRGRGGAGFPTGNKWSFVPKEAKQKYLTVNADESEPGTFKDRVLMEEDPHQLIEGSAICCWAVGATVCYIYIRGEYVEAGDILERAIEEAYAKGILGKDVLGSGFELDMVVHRGAGAYICGEETGLLESLEGKRGQPRVKPPFPAVVGAFGMPTVINNVETLCCVTHILDRGPEWFKAIGTDERNTGPKLYAVSGHVEKPGTYEVPIGITFQELLDLCGGMWRGPSGDGPARQLKAFIPGGASAPVLTAADRHIKLDFDTLAKAGTMLGSAAVMVMDETASMLQVAKRSAKFFNHESCGQCTPCREGTNWLEVLLTHAAHGEATTQEVDLVPQVAKQIGGNSLCALGDAAMMGVGPIVEKFRDEILAEVRAAATHAHGNGNGRRAALPVLQGA
ncbi:MAG TPA: NADH-quinone oxidoreductase subunit NuoF [Thermoanaerobaculia bacterium]|nr:NADH-quinone oxidoreductase subunit NuoF [Thermoanaerobaculia bacterium]